MKKNYLLILSIGLSVVAFGQKKQGNTAPRDKGLTIDNTSSVKKKASFKNKAAGDVVFSETFNGSIGNWTTSVGDDGALWLFDTDGPDGQYSSTTNADIITSTTAANGFMIFDADLSNSASADPATFVDRSGSLISPVIDLTATPNVIISFEQAYRHCCSNTFAPLLEVSSDGFTTFTTFDVTADNISTNDFSETVTTQVSIGDFLATNPNLANVQIRFNFDGIAQGTSHYFWQIDDFQIIEQYANEVSITKLWLGDVVADFEVTETTADLAGNLIVQAPLKNYGSNIPTSFKLRTRVLDATNVELFNQAGGTLSNNFTSILDTITYDTGFDLATLAIGDYTIEATIEYGATDAILTNNTITRTFKMTQANLSSINYDGNIERNSIGFDYGPSNPDGSTDMIVGAIFTLPIDKDVHGFDIAFSTGTTNYPTTIGEQVNLQIWEYMPNNPQDTRFVYVAGDYVYGVASSQLSTDGSFYTFNFSDAGASGVSGPFSLTGGKSYLAAFNHLGGDGKYLWYYTNTSDDDFSAWVKGPFGVADAVNWFNGSKDPLIKVNFETVASVKNNTFDAYNVSLYPNPTTQNTTLHYTLKNDAKVYYEITDLSGKKVLSTETFNKNEGHNTFEINTDNFSNGIYTIKLVSNNSITTHKLVVNK